VPVSPARAAAFDILLRVERESSYASDLLHSTAHAQLSAADHALATELVMGVLRWRSLLDAEIATASSQPLSRLDAEILVALRLALYQFRWLDRIPQRAALHESVELVKRARKRSAAPFVNAVLRKLSAAPPSAPRNQTPPPNENRLSESVPRESPSTEVLAHTFAHPLWLVERWSRAYGLSATHQICQHDQSIPTTAIRLRTPTAEQQLIQEGITLTPGALLASARRVQSGDITKSQAFRTGQIVIQDEASQLVAALLTPSALIDKSGILGCRILDCCAAPGGKTLALADHNPSAAILAIELHPHRARLLQKLLRAHSSSTSQIQIIAADAQHLPLTRQFDRVLADVPCSGTGTLARNPEIKWRLTLQDLNEDDLNEDDLTQLPQRQLAILRSALAHVAPGGRLIYSTCSLEKEENENVVEQALSENKSFRLLDCRDALNRLKESGQLTRPELSSSSSASLTSGPYLRTIPGAHPCDGFFAAILERF
jgi:16S rRNA (cytosine967-C5)-methyltransferase